MNILGSIRAFLSLRDWVYSLSLLIPFAVYNLALKADSIVSVPGLAPSLDLVRSDMFFNLGYVLFWLGLFAVVRSKGPLRLATVVLFHVVTILVVIVTTFAHQYFRETGATLDYRIIALWVPDLKEVAPILTHGVSPWAWALLFVALFYAALGPLLVTRLIERRGGRSERPRIGGPKIYFLGPLGVWLLALGLGWLSLLMGASPTDFASVASVSFVRDPFVNLVLTGVKEMTSQEDAPDARAAEQTGENTVAHASLARTPRTQKRNVVLIHLESTRMEATTPYNKGLETAPFLDEFSKSSLLAERYYTTVTHTSKASVSVNCGIEPHIVQPVTEAGSDGIPGPCLATLLKEQGYDTAFFQSSTEEFEDFGGLVRNFGYQDYYPLESMGTEGFEKTNYFGYEDDIMLKPSEEWLKGHENKPFMAEYLMGTGHHDYQCLGTRYGYKDFSRGDSLNRYLNCMRLQDIFVKNLIDQYKQLGLYENTIFVIYGDHGEGFGEHGLYVHDDIPYEEGLKVPLLIHAPGWFENGERVKELSNHTDILPTVIELLGYELRNGKYPGYSLLHSLPEDRTLMFSCFHEEQCLTSIKGTEKYIYHYGNQPQEVFDLSEDPLEKHNLADERGEEELNKWREDLLAWRSGANAMYTPTS